jgi:hypothetical protein
MAFSATTAFSSVTISKTNLTWMSIPFLYKAFSSLLTFSWFSSVTYSKISFIGKLIIHVYDTFSNRLFFSSILIFYKSFSNLIFLTIVSSNNLPNKVSVRHPSIPLPHVALSPFIVLFCISPKAEMSSWLQWTWISPKRDFVAIWCHLDMSKQIITL